MSRRKLLNIGIGLIIAGLSMYLYTTTQPQTDNKPLARLATDKTYVVKVYDGDTLEISRGTQKFKVRLIGVDTPEVVDPRKPVQCFGEQASARTKQLLSVGAEVKLEFDPSQGQTDKYGRTLAYIFMSNGQMLNLQLVTEGYAHEYTYQNNPYKYQAEFKAAQEAAQRGQLGLWSPTTCNGDTTHAAH